MFGMGTGVALWVWAPTNPPTRLFIESEEFYFSTSNPRSQTPDVYPGLLVTFSFRVSVGIEVIPGRMIRIESVIDPEDQALDR